MKNPNKVLASLNPFESCLSFWEKKKRPGSAHRASSGPLTPALSLTLFWLFLPADTLLLLCKITFLLWIILHHGKEAKIRASGAPHTAFLLSRLPSESGRTQPHPVLCLALISHPKLPGHRFDPDLTTSSPSSNPEILLPLLSSEESGLSGPEPAPPPAVTDIDRQAG